MTLTAHTRLNIDPLDKLLLVPSSHDSWILQLGTDTQKVEMEIVPPINIREIRLLRNSNRLILTRVNSKC